MKSGNFSIKDRINSFKYALNGLRMLIKNEHNARVHLIAAAMTIVACFYFSLNTMEVAFVVFSIGLVFITELLNTAIEQIANFVEPEKNKKIGEIKDYAAGAVFVAALVALTISLIIFIPKIITTI